MPNTVDFLNNEKASDFEKLIFSFFINRTKLIKENLKDFDILLQSYKKEYIGIIINPNLNKKELNSFISKIYNSYKSHLKIVNKFISKDKFDPIDANHLPIKSKTTKRK